MIYMMAMVMIEKVVSKMYTCTQQLVQYMHVQSTWWWYLCMYETVHCDTGTSASQPTLRQLFNALQPVSADWYALGIQLDYDASTLSIIREDNHHKVERCMNDLLSKWLQKYPHKGWKDIIGALRKTDRNDVADEVEIQYISPSPGVAVWEGLGFNDFLCRVYLRSPSPVDSPNHHHHTTTYTTTTSLNIIMLVYFILLLSCVG